MLRLDGTDEQCLDRDTVAADLVRAQWSPDGTKLVFTDDYWRLFLEPDVWVLDVASGELRNLTDDGVDKLDIKAPDEAADIDLLPSWSPDGETVRFARGGIKSESVRLVSVPVDGGDASDIREIPCATKELGALAWSDNGVAWTCGINEAVVSVAGLSGAGEASVPAEGGEDRSLLSFSADGRWLLIDSASAYSNYQASGGRAMVVPAGGGDPVPVADGDVSFPTWSPTGHAIVYITIGRSRKPDTLNVVAEPGGAPRELRDAKALAAADGQRLNWGGDKLLAHVDHKPVLLTLGD